MDWQIWWIFSDPVTYVKPSPHTIRTMHIFSSSGRNLSKSRFYRMWLDLGKPSVWDPRVICAMCVFSSSGRKLSKSRFCHVTEFGKTLCMGFVQCAFLVAQVEICQTPDFVIHMSNNPSNCWHHLRSNTKAKQTFILTHLVPYPEPVAMGAD